MKIIKYVFLLISFFNMHVANATDLKEEIKDNKNPQFIPYKSNYHVGKRIDEYCKNDLIAYEIKRDYVGNSQTKIRFFTKILRFLKK